MVAEEIQKVLAPGGHVVIETHFSFSDHEQPWHFFQFNAHGLEVLFCKELGFEVLDSGLDTPIDAKFSNSAPHYLRGKSVMDLYCHASIIAKRASEPISNSIRPGKFDWRQVARRITRESMYPTDSDMLKREQLSAKTPKI